MEEAGRERIERCYDRETIANHLLELYRALTSERPS
jgi:glycosyltransferase involved in cell wall biosynthesis